MAQVDPPALVRLSEGLGAWQPIETAPRDGTAILGWCVHAADPYYDGDRLTIYAAHTEGLSHAADGPVVVEWGGAFDDSTWESPGCSLPDWWFQRGSEFEVTANPTHWMPIPPPPQSA
jgi:hypothetical protein